MNLNTHTIPARCRRIRHDLFADQSYHAVELTEDHLEQILAGKEAFNGHLLRVRPFEDSDGLEYATDLVESLHDPNVSYSPLSIALGRSTPPQPCSFELVAKDEAIKFYWSLPDARSSQSFRQQVTGLYPNCQVKRADDYFEDIQPGSYLAGSKLELSELKYRPLRGFEGPSSFDHDPYKGLLSTFDGHRDEIVALQFVFVPAQEHWNEGFFLEPSADRMADSLQYGRVGGSVLNPKLYDPSKKDLKTADFILQQKGAQAFYVNIRLLVFGVNADETVRRAATVGKTISNRFANNEIDQQLEQIPLQKDGLIKEANFGAARQFVYDTTTLTRNELASLVHLPGEEITSSRIDWTRKGIGNPPPARAPRVSKPPDQSYEREEAKIEDSIINTGDDDAAVENNGFEPGEDITEIDHSQLQGFPVANALAKLVERVAPEEGVADTLAEKIPSDRLGNDEGNVDAADADTDASAQRSGHGKGGHRQRTGGGASAGAADAEIDVSTDEKQEAFNELYRQWVRGELTRERVEAQYHEHVADNLIRKFEQRRADELGGVQGDRADSQTRQAQSTTSDQQADATDPSEATPGGRDDIDTDVVDAEMIDADASSSDTSSDSEDGFGIGGDFDPEDATETGTEAEAGSEAEDKAGVHSGSPAQDDDSPNLVPVGLDDDTGTADGRSRSTPPETSGLPEVPDTRLPDAFDGNLPAKDRRGLGNPAHSTYYAFDEQETEVTYRREPEFNQFLPFELKSFASGTGPGEYEEGQHLAGFDVRDRLINAHRRHRDDPIWLGYEMDAMDGLREVGIPRTSWFQHSVIFGTTGKGKSTLQKIMMLQVAQKGYGLLCIDPKGDMVDDLIRELPEDRMDDIIWIEPGSENFDKVAGINFLDPGPVASEREFNREVESIIDDLRAVLRGGEYWGPKMEGICSNIARAMIRSRRKFTLMDMYSVLNSEQARQQFSNIVSREGMQFIHEYTQRIAEMDHEAIDPVLRRIQDWIEDPITRGVVAHREGTINLSEAVESGKIILVRNAFDSEELRKVIATGVMRRVWSTIRKREKLPEKDREPFFTFIDEFDDVASDNLAMDKMLSKARAGKMSVTVALQNPSQIEEQAPQALDQLFGNTETTISFGVNKADDGEYIAREFIDDDIDGPVLQNLPDYMTLTTVTVPDEDGPKKSDPLALDTFADAPHRRTKEEAHELIDEKLDEEYGVDPLEEGFEATKNTLLDVGAESDLATSFLEAVWGAQVRENAVDVLECNPTTLDPAPDLAMEGTDTAPDASDDDGDGEGGRGETAEATAADGAGYQAVRVDDALDGFERRTGLDFGALPAGITIPADYVEVIDPDEDDGLVDTRQSFSGGGNRKMEQINDPDLLVSITDEGIRRVLEEEASWDPTTEKHVETIRQAFMFLSAVGFDVSVVRQQQKTSLPDAVAHPPIDESVVPREAPEVLEQFREQYPVAAELSQGTVVNVEAETQTYAKPARTLINLARAVNSGQRCLFLVPDTPRDGDSKSPALRLHRVLKDPPFYRGTLTLLPNEDAEDIDDPDNPDEHKVYYNKPEYLDLSGDDEEVRKHALIPKDGGQQSSTWIRDGDLVRLYTGMKRGSEMGRLDVHRESPSTSTFSVWTRYNQYDDEWVVYPGGEPEVYDTLAELEEEWQIVYEPFVPQMEFDRTPEDDDWDILEVDLSSLVWGDDDTQSVDDSEHPLEAALAAGPNASSAGDTPVNDLEDPRITDLSYLPEEVAVEHDITPGLDLTENELVDTNEVRGESILAIRRAGLTREQIHEPTLVDTSTIETGETHIWNKNADYGDSEVPDDARHPVIPPSVRDDYDGLDPLILQDDDPATAVEEDPPPGTGSPAAGDGESAEAGTSSSDAPEGTGNAGTPGGAEADADSTDDGDGSEDRNDEEELEVDFDESGFQTEEPVTADDGEEEDGPVDILGAGDGGADATDAGSPSSGGGKELTAEDLTPDDAGDAQPDYNTDSDSQSMAQNQHVSTTYSIGDEPTEIEDIPFEISEQTIANKFGGTDDKDPRKELVWKRTWENAGLSPLTPIRADRMVAAVRQAGLRQDQAKLAVSIGEAYGQLIPEEVNGIEAYRLPGPRDEPEAYLSAEDLKAARRRAMWEPAWEESRADPDEDLLPQKELLTHIRFVRSLSEDEGEAAIGTAYEEGVLVEHKDGIELGTKTLPEFWKEVVATSSNSCHQAIPRPWLIKHIGVGHDLEQRVAEATLEAALDVGLVYPADGDDRDYCINDPSDDQGPSIQQEAFDPEMWPVHPDGGSGSESDPDDDGDDDGSSDSDGGGGGKDPAPTDGDDEDGSGDNTNADVDEDGVSQTALDEHVPSGSSTASVDADADADDGGNADGTTPDSEDTSGYSDGTAGAGAAAGAVDAGGTSESSPDETDSETDSGTKGEDQSEDTDSDDTETADGETEDPAPTEQPLTFEDGISGTNDAGEPIATPNAQMQTDPEEVPFEVDFRAVQAALEHALQFFNNYLDREIEAHIEWNEQKAINAGFRLPETPREYFQGPDVDGGLTSETANEEKATALPIVEVAPVEDPDPDNNGVTTVTSARSGIKPELSLFLESEATYQYLGVNNRGWSQELVEEKKLGWAPADGEALYEHLREQGFGGQTILATGLVYSPRRYDDGGSESYAFTEDDEPLRAHFRGRYIFPYYDKEGRVAYMAARETAADDGHSADTMAGKYLKQMHRKPFSVVDEPIYGRETVEEGRPLVVTEGMPDAISAHDHGIPCISPVTTTFKTRHHPALLEIIRENDIPKVYFAQDSDPPSVEVPETVLEGDRADADERGGVGFDAEEAQREVELRNRLLGMSSDEDGKRDPRWIIDGLWDAYRGTPLERLARADRQGRREIHLSDEVDMDDEWDRHVPQEIDEAIEDLGLGGLDPWEFPVHLASDPAAPQAQGPIGKAVTLHHYGPGLTAAVDFGKELDEMTDDREGVWREDLREIDKQSQLWRMFADEITDDSADIDSLEDIPDSVLEKAYEGVVGEASGDGRDDEGRSTDGDEEAPVPAVGVEVIEMPQLGDEKRDLDDYLQEGWREITPILAWEIENIVPDSSTDDRDQGPVPLGWDAYGAVPTMKPATHPARSTGSSTARRDGFVDRGAGGGQIGSGLDDEEIEHRAKSEGYEALLGSDNPLWALDMTDVTGKPAGFRGKSTLGHFGDSENYFKISEDGSIATDFKRDAVYNAQHYLLCADGVRNPRRDCEPLTYREYFEVWRVAREERLVPEETPVPRKGLAWFAAAHDLAEPEEMLDDNVDDNVLSGVPSAGVFPEIPGEAFKQTLDLVEEETDVTPGRRAGDYSGSSTGATQSIPDEYGTMLIDLESLSPLKQFVEQILVWDDSPVQKDKAKDKVVSKQEVCDTFNGWIQAHQDYIDKGGAPYEEIDLEQKPLIGSFPKELERAMEEKGVEFESGKARINGSRPTVWYGLEVDDEFSSLSKYIQD